MAKMIIEGGHRLSGEIESSGSKNGALAVIAAALLVEDVVVLRNIPHIFDIYTMLDVLQAIGIHTQLSPDGTLTLDARYITTSEPPPNLVKKMRGSFSVLGPLLARTGLARVGIPGGCDIGSRPIDFHIKGINALGAVVRNDRGIIEASADRLLGNRIYLDFPSAGATQQIMTAACFAEGETVVENAASEPEVVDVANFLNQCGAKIRGAGTGTVTIEGVKRLRGIDYTIIPDRVEIGTFALAAANTLGDVFIRTTAPDHCGALIEKMREIGVAIRVDNAGIHVVAKRRLQATDIVTMPFPGFPTDLQQPMGAVLATSEGTSIITEKVYEHRFRYLQELDRMGADARFENRTAVIRGVPKLIGTAVTACDLRAGAALTIAALAADGRTEISDVEHIYRGYSCFEEKLNSLGAKVYSGEAAACLD